MGYFLNEFFYVEHWVDAQAAGIGMGSGFAPGQVVMFADISGSGVGFVQVDSYVWVLNDAIGSGIGSGQVNGWVLVFAIASGSGVGEVHVIGEIYWDEAWGHRWLRKVSPVIEWNRVE